MTYITDLPQANSIDPVQDMLAIVTNSLNATQKINRNTYLGLSSAPAGLTDSQTLTNKTLTSPTINGATLSGTLSGTYTIGGSPTFPSNVVTTTGSQTLTNKNISSAVINTPVITNATISSDAYVGFSSSNSGSIFGMSVSGGVLNSAALANAVNSAALQSGAVVTAALADSAVTPAKLLAGTGTSWPWQSWTPTLTNLSGGTLTFAKYTQIGKTVHFRFFYTLSGANVSGSVSFTLPVMSAAGNSNEVMNGMVHMVRAATAGYPGFMIYSNSTTVIINAMLVSGTYASDQALSSTVPNTWGANDTISCEGTYEAA